ncbi:ATP-binding cassette domain-containing protein, partial [Enterococcus faecalis]|uniref:ATP-binding cassette domain-containing protein n=1 Tax=Enterococcus faecalis TaxID=1351 RepID=UPI003CC576B0
IPRVEMLERVHDALERVRMLVFAKLEPAGLSGGQKQGVAIAGVVALRPVINILDEATSMLEPEGRAEDIATIPKIKQD